MPRQASPSAEPLARRSPSDGAQQDHAPLEAAGAKILDTPALLKRPVLDVNAERPDLVIKKQLLQAL